MSESQGFSRENIDKYFKFMGLVSVYALKKELDPPAIPQSELWSQKPEAEKIIQEFRLRSVRGGIQTTLIFLGTLGVSNWAFYKWRKPARWINRYTVFSMFPALIFAGHYYFSKTKLIGEDMKDDILFVMNDPEISVYVEEIIAQKSKDKEGAK